MEILPYTKLKDIRIRRKESIESMERKLSVVKQVSLVFA